MDKTTKTEEKPVNAFLVTAVIIGGVCVELVAVLVALSLKHTFNPPEDLFMVVTLSVFAVLLFLSSVVGASIIYPGKEAEGDQQGT